MTGRFFLFSILAIVSLVFTGCGTPGEDLAKRYNTTMNQLAEKLKSVKDAKSLEAALPEIKKLVDDVVSIDKQLKELQLTTEQTADLNKKFIDADLSKKLRDETTRIPVIAANDPDLKAATDKLVAIFHQANRYTEPAAKTGA